MNTNTDTTNNETETTVDTAKQKRAYGSALLLPVNGGSFSVEDLIGINKGISSASVRAKLKKAVDENRVRQVGKDKVEKRGRARFLYAVV